MGAMFISASAFDQDLGGWKVGALTDAGSNVRQFQTLPGPL